MVQVPLGQSAALRVGQFAELKRKFSEHDVKTFAALSGDNNPLHLDEKHVDPRFGKRIVHGMLTARSLAAG